MPVANIDLESPLDSPAASDASEASEALTGLPFPPLLKSHVLHCSYHFWHPLYRAITPKARLIPLSNAFLLYLRSDGIILPSETSPVNDTDSGVFSLPSSNASDASSQEDEPDPSSFWPEIHSQVKSTIAQLGGSVYPKLNWSAPKDATWIAATNDMDCRSPNDVYMLLKSSDFVTHDLEQVFDGCEEAPSGDGSDLDTNHQSLPYHLVLRKAIPNLIPSLEFRCFVRGRTLFAICQRDLNHYDFLPSLRPVLKSLIQDFFDRNLRDTFPDENFVFDVYVPQPKERGRVWLIDINPWAIRTDPLIFSWMELLSMPLPSTQSGVGEEEFVRMSISEHDYGRVHDIGIRPDTDTSSSSSHDDEDGRGDEQEAVEEQEEVETDLDFRLVNRDDPEAYTFNTPRYSAHKLPKDVVDAGGNGEAGLREFMTQWRDIVSRQEREDLDETL